MKCMHMISRDRNHSEGWEWGSTAVWNLSEKFIRFGCVTHPSEKFYKEALPQLKDGIKKTRPSEMEVSPYTC